MKKLVQIIFLIILTIPLAQSIQIQNYTILELPSIKNNSARAFSINNNNEIVGESETGEYHNSVPVKEAVIWKIQEEITMERIGTLGGKLSSARKINDDGKVTGWSAIGGGNVRGFIYEEGEFTATIPSLGGDDSLCYSINKKGKVACEADKIEGFEHAGLFDSSAKTLTDLGAFNDFHELKRGFSYAINDENYVVGMAQDRYGNFKAFLWDGNKMTDIGTLEGRTAVAKDINNKRNIVGNSETKLKITKAFIYRQDKMKELKSFPESRTRANAINEKNEVVGSAQDSEGNTQATIWKDKEIINLNNLIPNNSEWNLKEAYDINDAGYIVGQGILNGKLKAFILIPNQ